MAVKVGDLQDIEDYPAPRLVTSETAHYSRNLDVVPVIHIVRQHGQHTGRQGYVITACNRAMKWPHVNKHKPVAGDRLCKRCGTLDDFVNVWEENKIDTGRRRRERRVEERLRNVEFEANLNWDNLWKQVEEGIEEAALQAVEEGWFAVPAGFCDPPSGRWQIGEVEESAFDDCPDCEGKGIMFVADQMSDMSGFRDCTGCSGDGIVEREEQHSLLKYNKE